MKLLRALDRVLVRLETVLLVIFLGLMVILAFAQVVLRNVLGWGLLWGDPLVRQMVMWSGFMGAAIAASQDRHISIDALAKFLKGRVKDIVRVITSLLLPRCASIWPGPPGSSMLDEKQSGAK